MGKHAHNCITQYFESRLAPHASNAQGGPLCKRGGCVRTLRTPLPTGLQVEILSGRSSISTAVIRWPWKTHGREDMHFFLTQLLWLHRHSLLCPLPLTCMWTHCGQKMITDWLPWLASIPCAWWHVDYCGCEVAMWTQIIVHVPTAIFTSGMPSMCLSQAQM